MSFLQAESQTVEAVDILISDESMTAYLSDGRTVSVPLAWFPRLLAGSKKERETWELIGQGTGIHWPDLDEDISLEGILAGRGSMESTESLQSWLDTRKHTNPD